MYANWRFCKHGISLHLIKYLMYSVSHTPRSPLFPLWKCEKKLENFSHTDDYCCQHPVSNHWYLLARLCLMQPLKQNLCTELHRITSWKTVTSPVTAVRTSLCYTEYSETLIGLLLGLMDLNNEWRKFWLFKFDLGTLRLSIKWGETLNQRLLNGGSVAYAFDILVLSSPATFQ